MSFFKYHVFFCTNRRGESEQCCQDYGANEARDYVKQRLKALGMHGDGQIRVNKAGCMGRCENGPVIVVYPDAIWYTYVDRDDLDEIIDSHLANGQIVERLRI